MSAAALSPVRAIPRGERRCIDCGRRCKILRCERCQEQDRRRAAAQREYRQRHKATIAAAKREYYQRHKATLAAAQREYRQRHKATIAAAQREHYQRTRRPPEPTCAGCGVPLRYQGRGRPPVWCGGRAGCLAVDAPNPVQRYSRRVS